MNDEEQLNYAAKLIRDIRADQPGITQVDLAAVLCLAALTAQGSYAVVGKIIEAGD